MIETKFPGIGQTHGDNIDFAEEGFRDSDYILSDSIFPVSDPDSPEDSDLGDDDNEVNLTYYPSQPSNSGDSDEDGDKDHRGE